jgi:hypothetical protein
VASEPLKSKMSMFVPPERGVPSDDDRRPLKPTRLIPSRIQSLSRVSCVVSPCSVDSLSIGTAVCACCSYTCQPVNCFLDDRSIARSNSKSGIAVDSLTATSPTVTSHSPWPAFLLSGDSSFPHFTSIKLRCVLSSAATSRAFTQSSRRFI